MSPRFSILTSAYQTEAYLPMTIDSVRAQTFKDWELVVVDNGMSARIADIVTRSASADSRIRLLRQDNRGYAGGINTAAEHAKGEYLCPLDSDDLLLPRFCAVLDAALAEEPDLDAVAVNISRFSDGADHDMLGGFRTIPVRRRRLRVQDVVSGMVPYTGAIKRDTWSASGGLSLADDVESDILFWARLAGDGKVGIVHERLARVRERPTSSSRDPANIARFEDRMIRSFQLAAARSSTTVNRRASARAIRNIRYHVALRRGRTAFTAGDVASARHAVSDALAERRTARVLIVRVVLSLPAGPVRRLHAAKHASSARAQALGGRLATWWRSRRS